MMHVIHLHGSLGEKYGKTINLAGANPFQVMSGLYSRLGPAFREEIRTGNWHLTDGPVKPGNDLGEDDLPTAVFKRKHIHLLPAVHGASSTLRIIIGIVLIVVGTFTSIYGGAFLVNVGIGLVLGGVVEMLTKPKSGSPSQREGDEGSYIYNIATNVTSQGGPIPLLYGRVPRASSVVITTDFSSDEIAYVPPVPPRAPVNPRYRDQEPD